ncbi:hypothetical protein BJ878DRAFT_543271 [Calycina marina]|uniref:Heterokaryon incompatibility domain-containing protein n=1 Tax=Calycina marina TaxID=1763456 RepID=A0A9P7Z1Z1_9HELO|nr:hypothetical protein BJ878DRAFT_543271 [Calycina marina]
MKWLYRPGALADDNTRLIATDIYGVMKMVTCACLLFAVDSLGRRRSPLWTSIFQGCAVLLIGFVVRFDPLTKERTAPCEDTEEADCENFNSEIKVSRTVRDAMHLVRVIGLRYLWVDALCIRRDNEDMKKRLIHGMDYIYENATLAIIAGAGFDANSGLPGVTLRQHLPYEKETQIVGENYAPFWLGHSRPSLVVQWREGYAGDDLKFRNRVHVRTGPPWWNVKDVQDPNPSPFQCLVYRENNTFKIYREVVHEYSRRNLTNARDVMNAFQGIFNRFYTSEEAGQGLRNAQGIPLHFMPKALLWYPSETAIKRRDNRTTSGLEFASWSWASWVGAIDFIFEGKSGLDLIGGHGYETPMGTDSQFPRIIEIWASHLLVEPAFIIMTGHGNLWDCRVLSRSGIYKGAFRFDEPDGQQKVTELIALPYRKYSIAILGIRNQGGVSVRVGLGTINFQTIRWPLRSINSVPGLPWQPRLVRLR